MGLLGSNIAAPLGRSLGQSAVPIIIVSSGTMGNNGALSGIAAVSATHPSAYIYLPANAISAGSAAGFYYAVFSSTTAATVYNNTYTSGEATPPTSPTAFATTGPGAYTQVTTEVTMVTMTCPANAMGIKGQIETDALISMTNNANSKTIRFKFGASTTFSNNIPSSATARIAQCLGNRNAANSQVTNASGHTASYGSSTGALQTFSVDTTADVTILITAQLGTATDTVAIERYRTILYPKG